VPQESKDTPSVHLYVSGDLVNFSSIYLRRLPEIFKEVTLEMTSQTYQNFLIKITPV